MKSPRCPKCQAKMSEGFLVDSSHQAVRVAHWAEGAPTYWALRILKMRGRRKLPIQSWRCASCGYLESFANEPEAT